MFTEEQEKQQWVKDAFFFLQCFVVFASWVCWCGTQTELTEFSHILGKLEGTVKDTCVDNYQSFNEKNGSGLGDMSL